MTESKGSDEGRNPAIGRFAIPDKPEPVDTKGMCRFLLWWIIALWAMLAVAVWLFR